MEFLYRYAVLSVLKTLTPRHIRDFVVSADMMLNCEVFFFEGGNAAPSGRVIDSRRFKKKMLRSPGGVGGNDKNKFF